MVNPQQVWCRSFPTRTEIQVLLSEMKKARVSAGTASLVRRLAGYPPALRLALNLKSLLGQSALKVVDNVLVDGLSSVEKKALVELDTRLSVQAREIAHGLFNVQERWMLRRALAKKFEEAHYSYENKFDPRPLDAVLGDEETVDD